MAQGLQIQRLVRIYNALAQPEGQVDKSMQTPPAVFCLGRVVDEREFDTAILAFERLCETLPDKKLPLAGAGPALRDLKAQTEKLACSDKVHFLGWVVHEEVPRLMARARLIVISSRGGKPFGLVAVAAAWTRKPVVASASGALTEIVLHKKTGLLVLPEDAQQMAEAMLQLLRNETYAERPCQQAAISAQERFGVERFRREYESLYESLLQYP